MQRCINVQLGVATVAGNGDTSLLNHAASRSTGELKQIARTSTKRNRFPVSDPKSKLRLAAAGIATAAELVADARAHAGNPAVVPSGRASHFKASERTREDSYVGFRLITSKHGHFDI